MARDRNFVSLADCIRLAVATVGVLGTASLLFLMTFRERPAEASATIRPTEEDLLDVVVPDRDQLWAVGHHGRILRTGDGGKTWSFPASGVDTPLAGVAARDAKTGLAVGYGGVILRTTDGGERWAQVASGVDVYLTGVRFLAGGRALAAGEWGTVLESTDDGASWRTLTSGEHDFIIN
ncbi:MAG: WD40/YVTN/BNR-like repeat-containing protein, partial [Candidatus Binatia bacterium]